MAYAKEERLLVMVIVVLVMITTSETVYILSSGRTIREFSLMRMKCVPLKSPVGLNATEINDIREMFSSKREDCALLWTRRGVRDGDEGEVQLISDSNTQISEQFFDGAIAPVSILSINRSRVADSGRYTCTQRCKIVTSQDVTGDSLQLQQNQDSSDSITIQVVPYSSNQSSRTPWTRSWTVMGTVVNRDEPASDASGMFRSAHDIADREEKSDDPQHSNDNNSGGQNAAVDGDRPLIDKLTASQVSLYVGLVSFSLIVIMLCLVASLLTADSNQPVGSARRCARCHRFLRLREDPTPDVENAMSSTAVTTATSTSPPSVNFLPPPTYDEITQENETRISIGAPGCSHSTNHQPGEIAVTSPFPVCSVYSISTGFTSTAGACAVLMDSAAVIGTPCTTVITPGRLTPISGPPVRVHQRPCRTISPPHYLQVIKDWAARGILINRSLLTSPPPAYNDLPYCRYISDEQSTSGDDVISFSRNIDVLSYSAVD